MENPVKINLTFQADFNPADFECLLIKGATSLSEEDIPENNAWYAPDYVFAIDGDGMYQLFTRYKIRPEVRWQESIIVNCGGTYSALPSIKGLSKVIIDDWQEVQYDGDLEEQATEVQYN